MYVNRQSSLHCDFCTPPRRGLHAYWCQIAFKMGGLAFLVVANTDKLIVAARTESFIWRRIPARIRYMMGFVDWVLPKSVQSLQTCVAEGVLALTVLTKLKKSL